LVKRRSDPRKSRSGEAFGLWRNVNNLGRSSQTSGEKKPGDRIEAFPKSPKAC